MKKEAHAGPGSLAGLVSCGTPTLEQSVSGGLHPTLEQFRKKLQPMGRTHFLSPVQLRRRVLEQLWWGPGILPGSAHHSIYNAMAKLYSARIASEKSQLGGCRYTAVSDKDMIIL